MKKIVTITLMLCCLLATAGAQQRWNQRYQQYIDQYKDVAIEQMLKWKIPASITLAQGLFESGAGQSRLAVKGNNHFGIKCNGWNGLRMYEDDDARNECFRVYGSAYESYEDHSQFLRNNARYSGLFKLKLTDYRGWAKGLKKAGYATSSTYASKLIEIIQLYRLYEYDKASSYDKFMSAHSKDRMVGGQALHPIKMFNKNYYLVARRGDTFSALAEETGISARKLAKYNERDKRDVLDEGDIVWLKKKQKKAPKNYEDWLHYVRSGESMYSIAQKYGIRLKKLYKMNHMSPTDDLRVGQGLRLR